MPLAADRRVRPRLEGEHRADLAPADAAEIGWLAPRPPLPEAEDLTVVAHRGDHVRDGKDRLGAPERDPLVVHGTLLSASGRSEAARFLSVRLNSCPDGTRDPFARQGRSEKMALRAGTSSVAR